MLNPIKLKFLTEKYERENRNLKFHEEFIAVPGLKPVSGKFYAKHEAFVAQDAPEEFVSLVRRCASSTTKDNYSYPPPTVNMIYGWFSETLVPRPITDKRLIFPIRQCDFIKTEIYIKEVQKKTPQKKVVARPRRSS